MYALAGLMTIAFVILEAAFIRSDFTFNVVAGHSSTTTPTFYKLTARVVLAGGLAAAVGVAAVAVVEPGAVPHPRPGARDRPVRDRVLLGFAAFFRSLTVFCANPFATTHNPPAEGAGLDPLLLHPSMMIHPPMLYSGYTLLTIPFAFAIGALITRQARRRSGSR